MKRLALSLLLLILSTSLLLIMPVKSETVTPAFWVDPSTVTVLVDDVFTVNVWLNVTNAVGWQLALAWNNSILKCVDAQLNVPVQWGGTFDFYQANDTNANADVIGKAWLFGPGIENNITQYLNFSRDVFGGVHADPNVTGETGLYCKAVQTPPRPNITPVSVSMPIVTLTFQVLQAGTTSFQIIDHAMLVGYDPENHVGSFCSTQLVGNVYGPLGEVPIPIPYTSQNGLVNVLGDINNDGVIDIYDAILMAWN